MANQRRSPAHPRWLVSGRVTPPPRARRSHLAPLPIGKGRPTTAAKRPARPRRGGEPPESTRSSIRDGTPWTRSSHRHRRHNNAHQQISRTPVELAPRVSVVSLSRCSGRWSSGARGGAQVRSRRSCRRAGCRRGRHWCPSIGTGPDTRLRRPNACKMCRAASRGQHLARDWPSGPGPATEPSAQRCRGRPSRPGTPSPRSPTPTSSSMAPGWTWSRATSDVPRQQFRPQPDRVAAWTNAGACRAARTSSILQLAVPGRRHRQPDRPAIRPRKI